MSTMTSYTLRF